MARNADPTEGGSIPAWLLSVLLLLATGLSPAAVAAADLADPQSVKILDSLRESSNPANQLAYSEKLHRAREAAENIDAILPLFKDPQEMMAAAALLVEFGVNQDVNTLEYLGEDSATRAHLKPLSSAVIKLYAAAKDTALRQQKVLELQNLANPVVAQKWQTMDDVAKGAEYNKDMVVYADCIATSPKSMVDGHDQNKKELTPAEIAAKKKMDAMSLRLAMANDAIATLGEYDNPEYHVQARVRTMIAKLYMAAGEYKKAREKFATIYAEPSVIEPPPNPFEQFDARYFTAVTDVLAADLPAAQRSKAEFEKWQANLPEMLAKLNLSARTIAESERGISAAADMLQWRIEVLRGDLAGNEAERRRADDAAIAVLLKLRESQPQFAQHIDQQLAALMLRRQGNKAGAVDVEKKTLADAIEIGVSGTRRAAMLEPAKSPGGGGIGPRGAVFADGGNARKIVFVCDASGSMINKMPTLKDQLSKTIVALRPAQSFELIFFQDQKYDTFIKYEHRDSLVPATPDAKRDMSKFLEGVTTTGSTDPIPGIEAAFKTHPQLIYLLTDGDFPDNDAVLKKVRELDPDHKVKINTIAFVGDGDNEVAFLDLLKTIAKESGGTFKHVKESELSRSGRAFM